MRRLIRRGLDGLFPPTCAVCGLRTKRAAVCRDCYRELPWLVGGCPRCGTALADAAAGFCPSCRDRPLPVEAVIVPLHYAFPIDAMLKQLKFARRTALAPALAALTIPALRASAAPVDVIIPMPLHRWRHAVRGFNQAAEIARIVGRHTGIPVLQQLDRVRPTRPQSGLDAAARRRNLAGAFRVRPSRRTRLPDNILLVDDVITTGATIAAAANALLDAGAKTVSALAVARA